MNARHDPVLGDLDGLPLDGARRGRDEMPTRSRLIALVLGFVLPPVGFAYVGRPGLWIALIAGLVGIGAVFGWTGMVHSSAGFYVLVACGVLEKIAEIALPVFVARASRPPFEPRWYQNGVAYVVIGIVWIGVASIVTAHRGQVVGFEPFRVPSASMAPTLDIGDFIIVDERPEAIAHIARGDVVVYRTEEASFVKRVVAMPGSSVAVDASGLRVDGVPEVAQSFDTTRTGAVPASLRYATVTLQPDEFYVLGDNRGNSRDSRQLGPVPRDALVGKVTRIWYSLRDSSRIGPVR